MKFRDPDAKKTNLLQLLPVLFFVVTLIFAGHAVYQYAIGLEASLMWVGLWGILLLYFGARSWFALRKVFVWGEEETEV